MAGRRIYLVGSSGYPHYGDELVAASWLRRLAKTEPDAEVWLDCPSPGGAQLVLGDLHPNLRIVDTLFQLSWACPSEDPEEVVEFVAKGTRTPGFGFAHRAAGIEILQTADVFHVIGGAYVNSIWPKHVGVLAAGSVLAEEFSIRAAATGQSLVPSAASGALLDRLTSSYEVLDVTNADSKALLSGGNVTSTGDDAWLDLGDSVYDQRETRSTMICMQSDLLDVGLDGLIASVLETAKAWGLDGEKVGYVEAIPGEDRAVFEAVESELPGIRFYPFTELWAAGMPARRGQRWLTTRPSVHLTAAAAGAWGVAFPIKAGYDDAAHRGLVERGSRWAIGTPGEAAPDSHGDHGFGSTRGDLVQAKQDVAGRVYG